MGFSFFPFTIFPLQIKKWNLLTEFGEGRRKTEEGVKAVYIGREGGVGGFVQGRCGMGSCPMSGTGVGWVPLYYCLLLFFFFNFLF